MATSSSSGEGPTTQSGSIIIAARSYQVITIDGYSRSLNAEGSRPSFNSAPFRAGGRSWHVVYRPMGSPQRPENTDSISVFLALDDDDVVGVGVDEPVLAKVTFSLLDQDRREPAHRYTTTLKANNFSMSRGWGKERFVKRRDLEQSEHRLLKDDRFVIRVHVLTKKESPLPVVVPGPDLHRHLGDLLLSKNKEAATTTDVLFRVGGETFAAHRLILGARSPVFRAELFGPMKEGTATKAAIRVDDIEPRVFGALLAFIYTDAWPDQTTNQQEDEPAIMAQHLLAAADRYGMQRLKLMCEDRLRAHMDTSSVASVLALAEQHQCPGLRKACFDFLGSSSSVAFLEAMETQEFEYLARSCPSIMKEIISRLLARDHEKAMLGELGSRVPLFRGLS